jgi:hypothetical protein
LGNSITGVTGRGLGTSGRFFQALTAFDDEIESGLVEERQIADFFP